jgi:hypothetical protein
MKNLRFLAVLLTVILLSIKSFAQVATDEFSGSYKMQENPYVKVLKVNVKEGKVIISAEGLPDSELAKGKTADEFLLESMSATITFTRDGGKVKGLKIDAQGNSLLGEKEGASSSSSIAEYAATFKMADNEYVKKMIVNVKEGKLMITSDANPTEGAVLKASNTPDVFTTAIQGYDADIIFSRSGGKISSVKISVAGGQVVLTGEKE